LRYSIHGNEMAEQWVGRTVGGRKGETEIERMAGKKKRIKKITGKGMPTDSRRYVGMGRKGGRGEGRKPSNIMGGV
jgi:hypothetical protein